jgi:signal transduction histidine kinase
MGLEQWISSTAAVLFLALGVLVLVRGARSSLSPPFAFLCIAIFAYDTVEVIRHFAAEPLWDWLDGAMAALIAPPALYLIAAFVGKSRVLRVTLQVATAYFVLLALACLLPIALPTFHWFPGSEAWARAMLAGMLPTFGAAPFLLLRHARRSGPEERARTQLFSVALLLGVGGVSADLLALSGANAPRIAAPGIALSVVLLGALALRAQVVERITGLAVVNALALAALAVFGHLMVLAWFGDRTLLVMFGTVAVTLALLAVVRPLVASLTEERERARHLATLGRFSAQMAHDLKNPLAAIQGAAQYLTEETRQGRSLDPHAHFIDLILEQASRLGRVVDEYQRLGRVEAARTRVDLQKLAEGVVAAQAVAGQREGISILFESHGEPLPEVLADPDLIQVALENLVRNAREALSNGGRVGVIVTWEEHDVRLSVVDNGPGMDARTRERAFDEFYTTKANGSGLGLAYVARVAEAHGGRARITSDATRGTSVEIVLPIIKR